MVKHETLFNMRIFRSNISILFRYAKLGGVRLYFGVGRHKQIIMLHLQCYIFYCSRTICNPLFESVSGFLYKMELDHYLVCIGMLFSSVTFSSPSYVSVFLTVFILFSTAIF